jgi:vacuolar protein sorting-associated protein 26
MGINNLIHLEYQLFKTKYHTDDAIVGRILFLKVGIKIKDIELHLVKKETVGHGNSQTIENTLIAKYEICDGKPDVDDIIPIRMHIGSYDLSPTFPDINNYMSVKYFLKLVIIDEDDKQYNKQQDIYLWRKNL